MRIAALLATFFGAGLLTPGPGTWGTLVAWLMAYLLAYRFPVFQSPVVLFAMALIAFLVGVWACGAYARRIGVEDPSSAVIDEVSAMWLLLALSPPTLGGWIAAFFFFRLFDIVKLWPVGLMDRRLKGGFGIMADDVGAAVQAAIVLWVGHIIWGSLT